MRNIILDRLFELRSIDGFSKTTMRWSKCNVDGVHVSEVDFSSLSDDDLAQIFETIIYRRYRSMG